MLLVVGLGNPGTKYEQNRHNIGFLAVDDIAGKLGASSWTRKFGGEICEARMGDRRIFFLKPQTYMNLSGDSVLAAASFYKIPPENITVIHDDLDLATGTLRVKLGGGHGGHNGLRSIDAALGKEYHRVRVGISHPGHKDLVSDYVLHDFSKEEWQIQEKMLESITRHFEMLLSGDAAGFMNKVALEVKPKAAAPQE